MIRIIQNKLHEICVYVCVRVYTQHKGKLIFVLMYDDMKACSSHGSNIVQILNFSIRYGSVVSFTLRMIFPYKMKGCLVVDF
jgi:hypothetical protein